MNKVDHYRSCLQKLDSWDDYLLQESGLPGPRGNLELARAAVLEGSRADFNRWLTYTPDIAPTNNPGEFLAFCGTFGMGKLVCEGAIEYFADLRKMANDPRWRLREAVAMGLQMIGQKDIQMLLAELERWLDGSLLEQRAVAAGLCEPCLLTGAEVTGRVLDYLDHITTNLAATIDRSGEDFRVLRQGLGYCWSVAAAALPESGISYLEKWLKKTDPDIRWILRENLKKQRLIRAYGDWAINQAKRV